MKILRKINDFFFKTECLGCQTKGSLLCDECLSRLSQLEMNFCPFCFKISKFGSTCSFCQKRRSLDGAIVALNYQDPLVRKLIKSAMPKKDGIVLVPFVGTGSECVAAKELGQSYIGFELNPDYVRIAEKWLADTKCIPRLF